MAVIANYSINGADVEIGSISIDPASVGANTTATGTATLTGAKSGDTVTLFAPSGLTTGLVLVGASITADAELTYRLGNVTGSGVDAGATTFIYTLYKRVAR